MYVLSFEYFNNFSPNKTAITECRLSVPDYRRFHIEEYS